MTNTAKDRIVKAKVKLQKDNPFFSYLVMNLKFHEVDDEECKTMGVNAKGDCKYNAKFIEGLEIEELQSVLSHEVLHIALEHLIRGSSLNHQVFNIATDLAINYLLVQNGFKFGQELTKYALIPHGNYYTLQNGIKIEDLDKKVAETIYHELMKNDKIKQQIKKNKNGKGKNGSGNQEKNPFGEKRFDEHEYSNEQKQSQDYRDNQKKWKRVFTEASVYAKQQGKLPNGVEKLVDMVLDEKVGWKSLLYKYITRTLPYDYTYSRPSKRSISSGFFIPSILKENIEIVVSIDTSGSISQKDIGEFLSEVIGIGKSFNNVKMKIIVCDCEIKDVYDIQNVDIGTIQALKIRGGGGTSHIPVYDYIREKLPHTKFVINFTDGYTSFPKDESIKSIWVLPEGSCKDENIPFGEIIRLE